jgi:hypothetical protein
MPSCLKHCVMLIQNKLMNNSCHKEIYEHIMGAIQITIRQQCRESFSEGAFCAWVEQVGLVISRRKSEGRHSVLLNLKRRVKQHLQFLIGLPFHEG